MRDCIGGPADAGMRGGPDGRRRSRWIAGVREWPVCSNHCHSVTACRVQVGEAWPRGWQRRRVVGAAAAEVEEEKEEEHGPLAAGAVALSGSHPRTTTKSDGG